MKIQLNKSTSDNKDLPFTIVELQKLGLKFKYSVSGTFIYCILKKDANLFNMLSNVNKDLETMGFMAKKSSLDKYTFMRYVQDKEEVIFSLDTKGQPTITYTDNT
jgi:hypothetical protein